jgi:valyl-tRNA synthetase
MEEPQGDGWVREEDVLDTWFSSALWPFATLGWPDETPEYKAFYPTDVLSTARDILFLWVARMVMMGLRFTGDVPFSDVYVHSVIQAPDGRRMSKSLGTGIDPITEIDAHGADAVRFGLLAMSSTQDVRYSRERVEQGQALANKLFNASRFVLLNVGDDVGLEPFVGAGAPVEDRWIVSRLQQVVAETSEQIEQFEFSKATFGLYDFVYGELCDWYLELIKGREFDAQLSATVCYVLRSTLALAHPFIPFVTEQLWESVPGAEGLLIGAPFPLADEALIDAAAEQRVSDVIVAVTALRSWRSGANVKPGAQLGAKIDSPALDADGALVARLARLDLAAFDGEVTDSIAVPGGTIEISAGDAIDHEAQQRERAQRRSALEGEIERAETKLSNEAFVAKAPAELVAGEQAKLDRLREELAALGA